MEAQNATKGPHFLWRACHETIPTRTALVRRHDGTNLFCEFCKSDIETGAHLFFQCSYFLSIWSEDPFNFAHLYTKFCDGFLLFEGPGG